jgi:flavin reductase (DIM6/NTAB) family NADH-FMN oxidoreductase RutF
MIAVWEVGRLHRKHHAPRDAVPHAEREDYDGPMQQSPAELAEIDAALRLIDREVWIVTAAAESRRGGLLATWVSAASIDRERPVLLAGIGPNHFTAELVQASKAFAAHLLRLDQVELAWNFARDSGRGREKLAGLAALERQTGSPILADCLAWFDCRVFARYDAGDRLFFWADVIECKWNLPVGAGPLRESGFFRSLTDEQRQTLVADRNADAAKGCPLREKWRSQNPW